MRRLLSLLWFPYFFAAAFTLMGLYAFHHPAPHDMKIGLTANAGDQGVAQAFGTLEEEMGLTHAFDLVAVDSAAAGRKAVADSDLAATVDTGVLYMSSALSPTRADFLTGIAPRVAPRVSGSDIRVVDVNPTALGDVSGVSLFFYALPLLLVGLVTSIVLVQLGPWPLVNKVGAIASTGAFTSVFSYAVARSLNAIPQDLTLIGYGFALTQTIGWVTSTAALIGRQYFMPVAMTFVLVLGIPSSGATVNGDMLPGFIGWINSYLPFAAFINIARSSAYASGHNMLEPLAILGTWSIAGAAGLCLAGWLSDRARGSEAVPTSAHGYIHPER